MKKKIKIIFGGLIIVTFLFTSFSLIFAANPTYKLRFNTVAGPNEPQTLAMKKFAEVVGELSGGKIRVKVYHSGQLADQKTGILGVMRGSLDMTSDASPAWFSDLANYP